MMHIHKRYLQQILLQMFTADSAVENMYLSDDTATFLKVVSLSIFLRSLTTRLVAWNTCVCVCVVCVCMCVCVCVRVCVCV